MKASHANPQQIFPKTKIASRRAVAPVVATLLLAAIAVVGGVVVFSFSQESFASSQVSGTPQIEFLKIYGYDAKDVEKLQLHDGNEILSKNCCGVANGKKNYDERVAIYLQNHSVMPVTISELSFVGDKYSFVPVHKIGHWDKDQGMGQQPNPGEYIIVHGHDVGKKYLTLQENSAVIQPGEVVTILLDLQINIGVSNDAQLKITTTGGNTFASTIVIGEDSF
ncbi:MAG: hypothetical protein GTN35_03905 [Nitrososphaeria archaeon]|nr:hypothetical protein [Nitrosopumilaceae archaeon]NIP10163.1 hypothetical protein [Nitrosopumilaceae archaeon]NIP91527.1 hypothetical protein [Nitrososphaeria archaeon]NIS95362.1 hypothetical protein [Nitrosopumilaceae archaeon]